MEQPTLSTESLKQTKPIKCPECRSIFFRSSTILRRLPGLLVGSKDDIIIPIPVSRCDDCGNILPSEFESLAKVIPDILELDSPDSETKSLIYET